MLKMRNAVLALSTLALVFPLPAFAADNNIPDYKEVASFVANDGNKTGYSADIEGDYVAYTRAQGSSMDFAHYVGPNDDDWEVTTVQAPEAGVDFGSSVVFNDDATQAFVSSSRAAQIHIYSRTEANNWQLERTISPSGLPDRVSSFGKTFGETLAFVDNTLVVGVPNARVDGKNNTGFAYAVTITPTDATWNALIPTSPIGNSITGQSVAINGNLVAISAVQNSDANGQRVGGVYLWDLSTNDQPKFTSQPTGDQKVCPSGPGGGPAFGMSLSFLGNVLIVGSPVEVNYTGDDASTGCTQEAVTAGETTQGALYFFDESLTQLGGKLIPPAQTEGFGHSLATNGNILLANGSNLEDEHAGEVYVYEATSLNLSGSGDENNRQSVTPIQKLTASDAEPNDNFGQQLYGQGLQLSGEKAVIASPNAKSGVGAVYLFAPIGRVDPVVTDGVKVNDVSVTYGQSVKLEANITTDEFNYPNARALFEVAGQEIASIDVTSKHLEITPDPTRFSAGTYTVDVTLFDENDAAIDGYFGSAKLLVNPAATTTTIAVDTAQAAPIVSGTVTAQYNTDPTGDVTIFLDGVEVATVPVTDGSYQWQDNRRASIADSDVLVKYLGDGNHSPSQAERRALAPSPTATTATPQPTETSVTPTSPSDGNLAKTGAPANVIIAVTLVALVLGAALRVSFLRRSSESVRRLGQK